MTKWATITGTLDEASYFDDLVASIIASESKPLPEREQEFGSVIVEWQDVGGKSAFIRSVGGTIDDRHLVETIVEAQLRPFGYRRASWSWDDEQFRKTADWSDVMQKAKRLIQTGKVQLLRNGYNNIVAQVQGDHGTYQPEISRQDPSSRAITGSNCECNWGEFQNTPRTRNWKRFQDRPCAHILAAYWKALSAPLDEDLDPSGGQGGQPAPAPMGGPVSPGAPPPGQPPQMGQGAPQDAAQTPQSPADVLPQFPMANPPPPANPASIPGLKGPTPTDPVAIPAGPGGAFSSVRTAWDFGWTFEAGAFDEVDVPPSPLGQTTTPPYSNGDLVRLRYPDTANYVGRPESGMAGQEMTMEPNSVGEVLGTEPSTGMVNVLWMGKQFDQMGEKQPFGATGWHFQHYLTPETNSRPPGPAVRRAR